MFEDRLAFDVDKGLTQQGIGWEKREINADNWYYIERIIDNFHRLLRGGCLFSSTYNFTQQFVGDAHWASRSPGTRDARVCVPYMDVQKSVSI